MPLPTTFAGLSARGEGLFSFLSRSRAPIANLWVTDQASTNIWKCTTTGTFTSYNVGYSSLDCICYGPDGNLWWGGYGAYGKTTPTGSTTGFSFYSSTDTVSGICFGADGKIYMSASGSSNIYVYTTGGTLTTYSIPGNSYSVCLDNYSGNVWFACRNSYVGYITPTGTVVSYSSGTGSYAIDSIVSQNNGTLSYSATYSTRARNFFYYYAYVYNITTSGTVTALYLTNSGLASSITYSPTTNYLYVSTTEPSIYTITANLITVSDQSYTNTPTSLTIGPNSDVWYSGYGYVGDLQTYSNYSPSGTTFTSICAGP